jgi:hypothetical protein
MELDMNLKIDQLCGDSLFQLNLAIWLAQPEPNGFSIRAIFYESGFTIYSIGPLLPLPPDIRLIIDKAKFDCQDAARPDLILATANRTKICFLECKRSSFGVISTTAQQARTLLLLTGPIVPEVLALGPRGSAQGILTYLTRKDQVEDLQRTLDIIKKEIANTKLGMGKYGCFGITSDEKAILIEYSDELKKLMHLREGSPIEILPITADTDPRPLYFIPYDPSVFNEQSEGEEKLCRRILFERFLSYILCKLGSAIVPSELVLTRIEILKSVTFDIYETWEDNEAKKHFRSLLRDFMRSLTNNLDPDIRKLIEHDPKRSWVFQLENVKTHEEILNQVSKFKPEDMDLTKEMAPELFDY